MTTKITSDNIEQSTIDSLTSGPVIANVQIANSSWSALDDTAVDSAGGFILINGSKFANGCSVIVGNTVATSVSFVSSSQIRVQVPSRPNASYVLYLTNPDGGTAIRVNGLTYSNTPIWATGSALSNGVVDVAVSVSLSATSDSNVAYSVAAGSSLPSGITLASNGLLSGTVSGISADTTYNFTVVATDVQLQDASRSFSITITAGDLNLKDTVLLLNGENASNTWVTDSSNNAFDITVNGDARPSAFSPYETVWSNYFDGTGDFLTSPLNSVNTRTAFTIECWVYALSRTSLCFYSASSTSEAGASMYFHELSGTFYFGDSASNPITFLSSLVPLNSWFHMATTFDGTTYRLFINGSLVGSTGTLLANNNLLSIMIGARTSGATHHSNAYFSNFRVIKGTALYTANFTPPTSPLTAIANTSLLTCQSNRFIDNSTNNYTITRGGDVLISNFGPFVETDIATGSGYFDGTGDWLTLPSNSNLLMGSGNFTIEYWIYFTSVSATNESYNTHFSYGGSGNTIRVFTFFANGNYFFDVWTGGTQLIRTVNANPPISRWAHVAIVRNGSTLTAYLNGAVVSSVTNTTDFNAGTLTIGSEAGFGSITGHISNFRAVKGTAVYTAAFTPPTSPLTAIANTSLLTLQSRTGENNNRFVDTSGINNIITRNGNVTQGTFSPFQRGGWSNYFDGTGDYLSVPSATALNLSTGSFTIEAFVNISATSYLFARRSVVTARGLTLYYDSSTSKFIFLAGDTNNLAWEVNITSTNNFSMNRWIHVAITRNSSNVFTLWVNGNSEATTTSSVTIADDASNFLIGGIDNTGIYTGYISNFRILQGTALYTSAFTPPTLPLTPIANTSLLTCADNGFIDDSPYNFTITRNGDVSVQPYSPFNAHINIPNSSSVYFDGSGDYLEIPTNTPLAFGTGDFTCESWVYITAAPGAGSASALWGDIRWNNGYQSGWYTHINPNLTVTARIAGSWTEVVSSNALTLNSWNHVAVSRQSGTFRLFINGVLGGSASSSANYTNAEPFKVGIAFIDGLLYPFTGYISNLRAVKGVAVYTGNFAVPNLAQLQTSGASSANAYSSTTNVNTSFSAANTSLLACQSNTIIDNSINAFPITVNGDTRARPLNPIGLNVSLALGSSGSYSIANEGGSIYFDGTGDRLIIPTNTFLNLTDDFTIEFWIFPTAWAAYNVIFDTSSNGGVGSDMTELWFTNTGALEYYVRGTIILSGSGFVLNQWQHVALSKSGTSQRLFLNGRLIASATSVTQPNSGFSWYFGDRVSGAANGQYPMAGYLSGVRIIKSTALYTTGFVPPFAPPTPISGTTLLLNGTSGGIIDYTRKNNLETVGNVRIRSNIKKYGNGSMFFDGTGDYIYQPSSINYGYGTGNFTIEFWLYLNSTGLQTILTHLASNPQVKPHIYYSSGVRLYVNGADVITGGTVTISTWTHIALVRNSGSTRLYIDGTQSGSTYTDSNNYGSSSPLIIADYGVPVTGTNQLNGYIDDLRITKGVARYTSNFTPPVALPTN